jgi:hypothetical protein
MVTRIGPSRSSSENPVTPPSRSKARLTTAAPIRRRRSSTRDSQSGRTGLVIARAPSGARGDPEHGLQQHEGRGRRPRLGDASHGVGHDAACPLAIEPAVQLGQPEVARGRAGVE